MTTKRSDCKFSNKVMQIYASNVLKYYHPHGCSIYEYVCNALSKDGYPRPLNISKEDWVFSHWLMIGGNLKKKKQSKKYYVVKKKPFNLKEEFAQSNEFLQSFEWRQVRMQALIKHGRKCQCCGATPESGAIMNVDHIKPRKTHPELALTLNNLQVLCHECNHGKGNWSSYDFRL